MGLICPNCKKELVKKNINSIEIDFCENGCSGIWFDDQEIKKIREVPTDTNDFEQVEGNFVPKSKEVAINEAARNCPRCNIELYRYNWDMKSDIFLDSCDKCGGVWVDEGELNGMRQYMAKLAETKLPEEEYQQKLAAISQETQAKFEHDQDEDIKKIIDWDFFVLDDVLRFLVKKFSN